MVGLCFTINFILLLRNKDDCGVYYKRMRPMTTASYKDLAIMILRITFDVWDFWGSRSYAAGIVGIADSKKWRHKLMLIFMNGVLECG